MKKIQTKKKLIKKCKRAHKKFKKRFEALYVYFTQLYMLYEY